MVIEPTDGVFEGASGLVVHAADCKARSETRRAMRLELGRITGGHAVPEQRVVVVAAAVVPYSGAHL